MLPAKHGFICLTAFAALALHQVVEVLNLAVKLLKCLLSLATICELFRESGYHLLKSVHQLLLEVLERINVELIVELITHVSKEIHHLFSEATTVAIVLTGPFLFSVIIDRSAVVTIDSSIDVVEFLLERVNSILELLEVFIPKTVIIVTNVVKRLVEVVDSSL